MASGDGNGWVSCRCGHRHWGRHGAAGLVLLRIPPAPSPRPQVLLQLRAGWTHEGGTWAVVGGARDGHEPLAAAALREADEEAGLDPRLIRILGLHAGVDHGDWSYTYVLALASAGIAVGPITAESEELRWVDLADVAGLPLHAGFEATWPALRARIDTELASLAPNRPAPG